MKTIGRLIIDKELSISEIIKLAELSDFKEVTITEKKRFWRTKSLLITVKMVRLLVSNRFVFWWNVTKLLQLYEAHGLIRKDEPETPEIEKGKKIRDRLDSMIYFFAVNLRLSPLSVEKEFRQRDIIRTYNEIILTEIKHKLDFFFAQHNFESFQKAIKELQRRVIKDDTNNTTEYKQLETESNFNSTDDRPFLSSFTKNFTAGFN